LILNLLTNKNQNAVIYSGPSSLTSSHQIPIQNAQDLHSQQQQQQSENLNSHQQTNTVIVQYQQIIREQDLRLKELIQQNNDLSQTCAHLQENSRSISSILNEKNSQLELYSSEKLTMQAKLKELEIKNNLLEEK
jgi:hypothetical protein